MRRLLFTALAAVALVLVGSAAGSSPGTDARLTNDCHPGACGAGYVSAYTLATGNAYTDQTLGECTVKFAVGGAVPERVGGAVEGDDMHEPNSVIEQQHLIVESPGISGGQFA